MYIHTHIHTYIHTWMKGNLLGELTYVIMDPKNSYDRPSASWRTAQEASSTAQSKSKGFRTKEGDGAILSSRLKA
jgi:hypothetical protein